MARVKHKLVGLMAQRELQTGKRIKQSELAAEIGLPENTLSNWINNDVVKRVDHRVVVKICRYFGVQIGDLLFIDWNDPREFEDVF